VVTRCDPGPSSARASLRTGTDETSAVLVACGPPESEARPHKNGPSEQLREIVRQNGGRLDNAGAFEQFVALWGGEQESARKRFYEARKRGVESRMNSRPGRLHVGDRMQKKPFTTQAKWPSAARPR
jgi:hypothetical protein